MNIAILGAGFTGLSAGYRLSKKGHRITIFERQPFPGGLASGFKHSHWNWPLERTYHHLFTSDWHARKLLSQIGMGDRLFFRRPITASFYTQRLASRKSASSIKNKTSTTYRLDARSYSLDSISIHQLDSPLSLLKFPLLSFPDRLRTGAILSYLRLTPFWQDFEKTTAKEWLTHFMGKKSWQILWEPLFTSKFGQYADQVNMAWFWARVKKRSPQLGYIKGGFQAFAEKLAEKIIEQGGKIHYNTTVKKILYKQKKWQVMIKNHKSKRKKSLEIRNLKFEIIISTLPTPVFIKSTPQLPNDYIKRLRNIPHLHALSLILELREPFLPPINTAVGFDTRVDHSSKLSRHTDPAQSTTYNLQPTTPKRPYWLNICDPSWPFLALVEHTNFISPKHYGGSHLVYIGNYLPSNHEFFKKTKEELMEIFLPYLAKINPRILTPHFSLLTSYLFTAPFAQPVIGINYSQKRPPLSTPLPNLFLANLDSIYPWDRGTNYAIELGEKISKIII